MQYADLADNGALDAPEPATPTKEETQVAGIDSENEERRGSAPPQTAEVSSDKNDEISEEARTKEDKIAYTAAFSQALNRMSEKRLAKLGEEMKEGFLNDNPAVDEAMRIIGENALREDLASIKAAYPEVSESDPRKFGDVFVSLMATGKVDAVVAYEAQTAANARKRAAAAKTPGGIGGNGADEAPYVSRETARGFTKRDYASDPALMQRVREAMTKWK